MRGQKKHTGHTHSCIDACLARHPRPHRRPGECACILNELSINGKHLRARAIPCQSVPHCWLPTFFRLLASRTRASPTPPDGSSQHGAEALPPKRRAGGGNRHAGGSGDRLTKTADAARSTPHPCLHSLAAPCPENMHLHRIATLCSALQGFFDYCRICGRFYVSLTPPCSMSIFPRFPTFPAFSNFYIQVGQYSGRD